MGQDFPRGGDPTAARKSGVFVNGDGMAYDAATGLFVPTELANPAQSPTADEKAALAGVGAPSDANRYLTRNSAARTHEAGQRALRGSVNTNVGGVASILEGTGFSVVRSSVGAIDITYDVPFGDVPTPSALNGQGAFVGTIIVGTGSNTINGIRLISFNVETFAATDGIIHFRVEGPA